MGRSLYHIKNLRTVREDDARMTQDELKAATNVSVKTISQIENNPDKKVSTRTVQRLEDGLGKHGHKLLKVKVRAG